jgi:hypothetical protein
MRRPEMLPAASPPNLIFNLFDVDGDSAFVFLVSGLLVFLMVAMDVVTRDGLGVAAAVWPSRSWLRTHGQRWYRRPLHPAHSAVPEQLVQLKPPSLACVPACSLPTSPPLS